MTAPTRDHSRSIRIHVHLRGADVALMPSMGPAEIWYFIAHSDLPPEDELPSWCIRVTPLSAVRRIFATQANTIEIPEPLWARFLPTGLTLMLAARFARVATGTPKRTVFYALENNEPEQALFGDARLPAVLRKIFVRLLGWLESALVDRVAFGSPSARKAYENMRSFRAKESLVLTELPARPDNIGLAEEPATHDGSESRSTRGRALFVGGLEYRKGVQPLLDAWERVERVLPEATITVVGSGPLEDTVTRWAALRPIHRTHLGQVPHSDLAEHYASADVLVAPSVRDGRWREQIGLQLRESLSHGLTLVATDETGLADWLGQNGHQVVPAAEVHSSLAPAIVAAMTSPIPRNIVKRSLPRVDGRVAADAWLHGNA